MKQLGLVFWVLMMTGFFSYSQIGGKHTYQFLSLSPSPHQAALGSKNITLFGSDPIHGLYNPASINPEMGSRLSMNYRPYFSGINMGTAAYVHTWDRNFKAVHFGVQYIDYGSFDGRDEFGNPTESFSGNEIALSGGYAYNIPWTEWYVGANLKFISSTLEQYQSFGMVIDLGVYYKIPSIEFEAALVVKNLGTQLTTYSGLKESLPLEILIGLSQELEFLPLRWHVTFQNLQDWNLSYVNENRITSSIDGGASSENTSFLKETLQHLVLGAELFPDRLFSVRLGYNFRRGEELRILEQRNFSGFSTGLGITLKRFRFHYSYARYTTAGNASVFGVTIDMNP